METTLDQPVKTCRRCRMPVRVIAPGIAVVEGTDTTADGLTFCPPDPDREPKGDHRI